MTFTFGRICDNILSTACNIMSLQSTRQPNSLNGSPSPWMGWMTMICSLSASNVTLLILPHLCTVVRQESIFWWHSAFGLFLSKFWKHLSRLQISMAYPLNWKLDVLCRRRNCSRGGGPGRFLGRLGRQWWFHQIRYPRQRRLPFVVASRMTKNSVQLVGCNCVPTPALWSFANI